LLLLSPALSRRRRRRRRLRFNQASEAAFERVAADLPADTSGGPNGGRPGPGVPMVLPPDDNVYETARANAHQAWDELLGTMTDYRVEIDEAETPRRTGVRLLERERLRDKAADGVQMLSTAEERARYAVRPITGQELRTSLSAVRSAFSARASRRVRIVAV